MIIQETFNVGRRMASNPFIPYRSAIFPALWLVLLFCIMNCSYAWDYGNGRHGTYVLTTNTTIEQLYQTVRLANDPVQYNPADSNAIPNFQNLIITNGATLTANPWNGSTGGRIILKVEATLSVASGSIISANGIGYRGGGWGSEGVQGESYLGGGSESKNANAGGGGGGYLIGANGYFTSAGGGGYGSGGGIGGGNPYTTYNGVDYRGAGGSTYGDQTLSTIYLGSGGGGGGVYAPQPFLYPFTGGAGGGVIALNVGILEINGQIQANGGVPNYYITGTPSVASSGGGGSGGSIMLRVKTAILGANQVTANGGSGSGNGGSGGGGRIVVGYFNSYSGTTSPSAYTLLDSNSDNITTIAVQPLSQTNFLSSNAVFSVGFSGLPPFVLQWYFNNAPIAGATNQTLSLVNLGFTNQGYYAVMVSNAVMTVLSSNAFLTVLDGWDSDGDGMPNYWEIQYGLNPNNPHDATNYPAGDKLTYLEKYLYGLNPLTNDTDGDGLTDYDEFFIYHTNPLLANTAGDGIPDGWKVKYGLDPLISDANNVAGFDGVTYMQVYQYDLTHTNQLNPNNPFAGDAGLSNFEMINNRQHTNSYYYDHEDRLVGAEYSRGISIAYIYDANGNLLRQTMFSRTPETNGLPVLWSFLHGLTNGTSADGPYGDVDGDGCSNYQEWLAGSSPIDSNSVPVLPGNAGTNIASFTLPFVPTNIVETAGNLDGLPGDEIVVGADGNPGTNGNSIFVFTQTATNWSMQKIGVGSFGVSSLAIGLFTNRPTVGIYAALHGTNGTGRIMEFANSGGVWQSNILAVSTNSSAFVLGVRDVDLLACYSATNGAAAALYSLSYSNGLWNSVVLNTNQSHRGAGRVGLVTGNINRFAGFRLLDGGGIEASDIGKEFLANRVLIPTNSIYYEKMDKWYFQTAPNLDWHGAESACEAQGYGLVTINSADENQWLSATFRFPFHIGLFANETSWNGYALFLGNWIWQSGSSSTYRQWGVDPTVVVSSYYDTFSAYMNSDGSWNTERPYDDYRTGIGDLSGAGGNSIFPEPGLNNVITRDSSLLPLQEANGFSILYSAVNDKNQSSAIDFGDEFLFEEIQVTTNGWTTNTFDRKVLSPRSISSSFGLAVADFTSSNYKIPFTAEPDGQLFYWTRTNAVGPLQRHIFSSDYAGKAWYGLSGVKMATGGDAVTGVVVDPTNQSMCNLIFWMPQGLLPTQQPTTASFETAPYAAVLPSTTSLGSNAVVTVRLWHDEGDASTPLLQFQILGATNWQNATLTGLDGSPYSSSTRVAALPTGSDHSVTWNALADMGPNVVTNILIRANASDFMLTGNWSLPTPFLLNTTITTSSYPTNSPVKFTGITPVHGGIQFAWQGGSNVLLYVQRSPSLIGTNAIWVNIWTGIPPTLNFGSYTDLFGTNRMEFYRIKSVSP